MIGMGLSDAWMAYCEEKLPEGSLEAPLTELVSPWRAIELFFDFMPMFTARHDAMSATRYDTVFDKEADGALAQLAVADTLSGWEELTAGAWRVLAERFTYAAVVCMANEAAGEPVIASLPKGLDRQSQARALLLMFLLGGARTIDRRVLPAKLDGSLPEFPANTSLRRQ